MKKFTLKFGIPGLLVLMLYAYPAVIKSQTTVILGMGALSCDYPFSTFWGSGRCQMLYTRDEIIAAGGSAGTITSIGMDVISFDSIPMNDFHIKLRNTNIATITAWIIDSMTTCYSGIYAVKGTIWQMITLQTPFVYDGRNLLVEFCYSNTTTSQNSIVCGFDTPQRVITYSMDNGVGCELNAIETYVTRPSLKYVEIPSSGVPSLPSNSEILIGPNPANEVVKVRSDSPVTAIEINDFTGNTVYSRKDINEMSFLINTSEFREGLYFVKVITSRGFRTAKVTILH